MAYKYNKALSLLKEATDKDHTGLFGKARTTFIFLVLFTLLSSIGSCLSPDIREGVEFNNLPWATRTEHQATEIKASLESLPFFGVKRRELFHKISSLAIRTLISEANYLTPDQEVGLYRPLSWHYAIARMLVSGIIAIAFLLILSIPYWLLALGAGIAIGYSRFLINNTYQRASLLSLCDRKISPFYSGIYGLLVPNSNRSGTETYVPTLVYPEKAPLPETRQTQLYDYLPAKLRDNPLIQELLQIVIYYRDYPSDVPPEHDFHIPESTDSLALDIASQETPDSKSPVWNPAYHTATNPDLNVDLDVETEENNKGIKNISGEDIENTFQGQIVSNAVNIESNCLAMISAALELHQSLTIEFERADDISRQAELSAKHFASSFYNKGNLHDAMAISLTPAKLALYGSLKVEWIIIAILAINASKCLVFKKKADLKKGDQYLQISLYPHLQARALLQSLPSFYSSCDSLERWLIRNSLIYSRRSATLGRALLPKNLPPDVKTLRDIVELSQYSAVSLPYYARLLRIENTLELYAERWRSNLTQHYRSFASKSGHTIGHTTPVPLPVIVPPNDFGFVHAGAFIFPLSKLISLMFGDTTDEQIAFSIKLIKEIQELGISTPQSSLPGSTVFWSLLNSVNTELSETAMHPFSGISESLPREKWFLARLALIRYNWLQFRIDELAPAKDNIVYTDTISAHHSSSLSSTDKPQEAARGAMATLRLKRLKELLGQDFALFFACDTNTNRSQVIYPSWEDYHGSQHL